MARSHQNKQIDKETKLILFDDDRAFSLIIKAFAKSMGVKVDCYESLADLGSVGRLANYDGAIIDHDLGIFDGVELAQYFESFCKGKIPVLLISGKGKSAPNTSWPDVIKGFLHKDSGPGTILTKISKIVSKKQSL